MRLGYRRLTANNGRSLPDSDVPSLGFHAVPKRSPDLLLTDQMPWKMPHHHQDRCSLPDHQVRLGSHLQGSLSSVRVHRGCYPYHQQSWLVCGNHEFLHPHEKWLFLRKYGSNPIDLDDQIRCWMPRRQEGLQAWCLTHSQYDPACRSRFPMAVQNQEYVS